MIIHPEKNDISQIKEIWKECFGDTDKAVDCFFDTVFSYENCYISKTDNTVKACLQMIPCNISYSSLLYDAKYMYAVCTKPEYQSQGIMSKLITEACKEEKQKGTKAILCAPSEDSLFDYYKRFGFSDCIYSSILFLNRAEIEKNAKPCDYTVSVDSKLFNEKRNEFLNGKEYVRFTADYISLAKGFGYKTAFNEKFFCSFFVDEDFVLVEDSFFKNEQGKNEMLYVLQNETNALEYEIDYCADNTELIGVIKYLDNIKLTDNRIYLGLKLE